MKRTTLLATAAILLALGGCQRTIGGLDTRSQPAPLTPAPAGTVSTSQLPPPQPASPTEFPQAPTAPAPSATDETQLAANAPAVTREALIGRWSVTSGGTRCDVFLALTKWTGGYRAASRGCAGPAASISAWDVQGKQVVLSDNSGNQVARLYQSAPERYDGSTAQGQQISLSR
jgi:Protease inhibitor Inh.